MSVPEYNTEIVNNIVSSLASMVPRNESTMATYDYIYDSTDHQTNTFGASQHLETILQQLFSKMSDNQTTYNAVSKNPALSSLSIVSSLPSSSSNEKNSFYLLSVISFWFVLIINPIVILFGVIGNLLTTYILIQFNIIKLPVSFYTIVLNLADTLNLLIPVFIFWLDNCFNRTPERGYFRDKSNFLCKALMCPDQFFSALSAWYMCAISFNRWYSVCRPSKYYLSQSARAYPKPSISLNGNLNEPACYNQRNSSLNSTARMPPSTSKSFYFPLNCCYCLTNNINYRQHIQAFRSIVIITLIGLFFCLYPIFMHELRPVISTNQHFFDLKQKVTHTYAVVWKRCYYSAKHEYAYDIIGIILSSLLHILPLTFVAVINLIIIIRLRQRQRLLLTLTDPNKTNNKKRTPSQDLNKHSPSQLTLPLISNRSQSSLENSPNRISPITTHKDQSTSTDLSNSKTKNSHPQIPHGSLRSTPRRHQTRDRNITIMLVGVALSYIILTIPYRLFWSYNVYIKRIHPEKLNSSLYLLKMHYIDHILRTIRNIHYGTNFIFFIFLSKIFRRKFYQTFIGKFLYKSNRFFHSNNTNYPAKIEQEHPSKLEESNGNHQTMTVINKNEHFKKIVNLHNSMDGTGISSNLPPTLIEMKINHRFNFKDEKKS